VRRGYVDAEVDAITAASKLSPGVKYSVNSSSQMAVGSHIVVGTQSKREREGGKGGRERGREEGEKARGNERGREGGERETSKPIFCDCWSDCVIWTVDGQWTLQWT